MLATLATFASFLGVSVLVIVTPGQDTALTIRNTLSGGRRAGVFTAVGIALGQDVWALATSAGLVAILAASSPAFTAVKLAGAAYLVYLGTLSLLRGLRRSEGRGLRALAGTNHGPDTRAALRQGVLSNLGNPKMAVFFTSLLPQFAPHGGASFAALLLLGIAFSLLTLLWLTGYAFAVARAGAVLQRARVRRALAAVTGAVLVGLGLRLATDR
jgi:threonine/homoserine/homoserine lactone efflux protein